MNPSRSRNQHELDEEDYGPSRTQQRREALAVLALAAQLVEMQPNRLIKLELPQDILDEVDRTRRMASHGARKRQLAFLAKIMRRHEDEVFASVRAELGENREKQRQETAAMHRLETLRDQLIDDDTDKPLAHLINQHPQLDRQHLRSLIRQARVEKASPSKPPKAYREIFQQLKQLAQQDDLADG